MKIRTKLVGAFLIVAVLVPVLGGAALGSVHGIDRRVQNLSDRAIPNLHAVQVLGEIQRDEQIAALTYLASGQADDRQTFTDLTRQFDERLAELTALDTSARGKELVSGVNEKRTRYAAQAAQLMFTRETRDRNFELLRATDATMVQELGRIRARFTPPGNTNPLDASTVPLALRNQVNDLLLSTEGMLHMVALEFALSTSFTLAPNDGVGSQFDRAAATFQSWMTNGLNAGGPDDRAILQRVQSAYGEFEPAARRIMSTTYVSSRYRAAFTNAASEVNASLNAYQQSVSADVSSARRSSSASVGRAPRIIISMSIIGFIVAGALGVWLAGTITRPLVQLRNAADRVSRGDVTDIAISLDTKDEVGDLAHAFRRMVVSLRILMSAGGESVEPSIGRL